MKHPTRDPTPAEQEAAFAAEYEQRTAGMNGRYDPNAPQAAEDRSGRPRPLKATSIASRLLETARGLPDPFWEWELMQEAWLKWPETFGVSGAIIFPSDKKVSSALSGKRGLVARGIFQRLPDGRLKLAGAKE